MSYDTDNIFAKILRGEIPSECVFEDDLTFAFMDMLQQFNEAAGGQEVFHLHYHVLPRHSGVSLRPPGKMAEGDVIKANADKIRAAVADLRFG